jgi:hypothetical protein
MTGISFSRLSPLKDWVFNSKETSTTGKKPSDGRRITKTKTKTKKKSVPQKVS